MGAVISLALIVALLPTAPAVGCSNGISWAANDRVAHGGGVVYDAFKGDISFTSQQDQNTGKTNHWIGVTDVGAGNGTRLVQTGYSLEWNGANFFTSFWYEFWSTHGDGQDPVYVTPNFFPDAGDILLFNMWAGSTNTYWGLTITDTSKPAPNNVIWNGNAHPATGANAYNWKQPIAEIATEWDSGPGQLNDGTAAFIAAQARNVSNNQFTLFENEPSSGNEDLVNTSCVLIESQTFPNVNAYAYHTWHHA